MLDFGSSGRVFVSMRNARKIEPEVTPLYIGQARAKAVG